MTIRDFNKEVRLGSEVRYNGRIRVVRDIDRRDHTVRLSEKGGPNLWIRCSEITLIRRKTE